MRSENQRYKHVERRVNPMVWVVGQHMLGFEAVEQTQYQLPVLLLQEILRQQSSAFSLQPVNVRHQPNMQRSRLACEMAAVLSAQAQAQGSACAIMA
jgi:hypothetical protein